MSLALLFPGQGSQFVGMGKEFFEHYPKAQEIFTRASSALHEDLARLCFSGPPDILKRTENAQPAILTVSVAIYEAIHTELKLGPKALAGHSLGEYTARVVSGALELETAVQLVRLRGKLMETACPAGTGGMGAILGLTRPVVESLCREACAPGEVLVPANFNSPEQTVISGHKTAVSKALKMAGERGAKASLPLEVSGPFHSPLMQSVETGLREALGKITYHDLRLPVVANCTAGFYQDKSAIPELLAKQVCHPVLWEDSILTLKKSGVDQIIEIGPGRVLSGLARRIDRDIQTANVENLESLEKYKNRS
ncbi:MAG: ACP S-malonyltransferase [Proteobacteria bacterium]|nr:ACP S-malonyltransferase [Pseudomonadota bacterium]